MKPIGPAPGSLPGKGPEPPPAPRREESGHYREKSAFARDTGWDEALKKMQVPDPWKKT